MARQNDLFGSPFVVTRQYTAAYGGATCQRGYKTEAGALRQFNHLKTIPSIEAAKVENAARAVIAEFERAAERLPEPA